MSKRTLRPYVDRGGPGLRYLDDGQLPTVRDPEVPERKTLTAEELRQRPEPELSDADAALEHWAAWAKSALSGIGWPEKTLLARVIEYGVLGAAQRGSGTLIVVGTMVAYDELCAWVEAAVMRLPLDERNVIARVYLNREPAEASARALGIGAGCLRTKLHRARKKVAEYLLLRSETKTGHTQ